MFKAIFLQKILNIIKKVNKIGKKYKNQACYIFSILLINYCKLYLTYFDYENLDSLGVKVNRANNAESLHFLIFHFSKDKVIFFRNFRLKIRNYERRIEFSPVSLTILSMVIGGCRELNSSLRNLLLVNKSANQTSG